MNNNNRFIDDKGLSESTSLTHLLSDDDSSVTIHINIPYGKVTCFPHANNAWNTCDLHVCLNKNCTLFPHV